MITLIIVLLIAGVCLYLAETYIPMSPPIRIVLRVIVVLCLILFILDAFGIYDSPLKLK